MLKLTGLPASPGIACGPARRIVRAALQVRRGSIQDPVAELARLDAALLQAEDELASLRERAGQQMGKEEAGIFTAQQAILQDPELQGRVRKLVEGEHVNAEFAWNEGVRFYAAMLRSVPDEYIAARAADVEDVGRRVLARLQGHTDERRQLDKPSIVVAEELTPADTVLLDRQYLLAFCTEGGGPTSHVAILSKALGVPCIVGLGAQLASVQDDSLLLVDGTTGELLIDPNEETQAEYLEKAAGLAALQKEAAASASQPAVTRDGRRLEVVANIGSLDDAVEAMRQGAEGVGLLRTEFLFLDRATAPDEEEQVRAYSAIFQAIGPSKPIVVRTLDIGGDKPAPYLDAPKEDNPFLGLRGVRLTLRFKSLFQTQLRSLLRAGVGYDLRVMFPMVSTPDEFIEARQLLYGCRTSLQAEGRACNQNCQVGIMVEVPSAAILARVFAREVDFFSIGTNDLSQYTLAAERTRTAVAYLADPLHPSVLQLIWQVIEAAHAQRKWVGLCGELAGNPLATPVLLGLGLDEFSASPRSLALLKQAIRKSSVDAGRAVAQKALEMSNAQEVRSFLQALYEES